MGLARISRWGGASMWREHLSVAQHCLLVLRIREQEEVLAPGEALRELLHDASEGLLGWDPIGPLKAHLGEPFRRLERRLQAAVAERYELPLRASALGRADLPPPQGGRSARGSLGSRPMSSAGAETICASGSE